MSRSRRRRSPSPAKPHHAGAAYRMDATVVALATRWSSCGWRPWVRRSRNANIEEEQVFKTCETWSVMVNLALRRTPRTLSVVTLRLFNEWLRRWMHGPGSSSSHNQLFRLRRVDFHVISFSPFLDVIVFIRDRSCTHNIKANTKEQHLILYITRNHKINCPLESVRYIR